MPGAIIHDQVAGAYEINFTALDETFLSSIIGDYGVVQIEVDRRAPAARTACISLVCIDHDGRSRAGALVAAKGGMCDFEGIV